MKKWLLAALCLMLLAGFAGCKPAEKIDLKVALLVPAGTHEDDTWIDIIWAGISGAYRTYGKTDENLKAEAETYDLTVQKVLCGENSTTAFLAEIKKLVEQGFTLIYLPGAEFAEALEEAQSLYPQCRFGAIDFTPATAGANVSTLLCNAAQSGFAAGFVAALRVEEGRFGALVGAEEAGAQQLSWGFQQGVLYANQHYGTRITMRAEDFLVAGTFADPSLGQQMTSQLFESGVKCVLLSARATGTGGLIEAKYLRANGQDVWVVGTDTDLFTPGVYDGNNSVTLTTAMRRYAEGVFRDIEGLLLTGQAPVSRVLDLANSGVGIAGSGNNLTADIRKELTAVVELINQGKIVVSAEKGDLF